MASANANANAPSTGIAPGPHSSENAKRRKEEHPRYFSIGQLVKNELKRIDSLSRREISAPTLTNSTKPLDLSVRRLSSECIQRERSISISSSVSGDQPHRIPSEVSAEGKDSVSLNSGSSTPEQIVCAPLLPGSPPLTPSPKRSSSSPRVTLSTSPISLGFPSSLQQQQQHHLLLSSFLPAEVTARLADSALNSSQPILDRKSLELAISMSASASAGNNSELSAQLSAVANKKTPTHMGGSASQSGPMPIVQPQIFVKQGVSKCKECNIVFCKYENYIAHKKHYCSARNLEESKDGKSKPSPPTSPIANMTGGAYQQLICAACGIKFTSLDNLSAHQMYYCPKRVELSVPQVRCRREIRPKMRLSQSTLHLQVAKEKCTKCKTVHDQSVPCPTSQNTYKCPLCDFVCGNAAESRRHVETHGGVKAFRCSICRYKGNTLRFVLRIFDSSLEYSIISLIISGECGLTFECISIRNPMISMRSTTSLAS